MREPGYEAGWRARLARQVQIEGGFNIVLLDRMVSERLVIGAERYGDEDFMQKEMIPEALEESADCVIYAMLETLKRNTLAAGGHHHLFRAGVHAGFVDYHFRQAARET